MVLYNETSCFSYKTIDLKVNEKMKTDSIKFSLLSCLVLQDKNLSIVIGLGR